jgi:hypothetical protein
MPAEKKIMHLTFRTALAAFVVALASALSLNAWMPLSWLVFLPALIVLWAALTRAALWLDALFAANRLAKLNQETRALADDIERQNTRARELFGMLSYKTETPPQAGVFHPFERFRNEVKIAQNLQHSLYYVRDYLSAAQNRVLERIRNDERELLLSRHAGQCPFGSGCPNQAVDHAVPNVHISETMQGSTAFHRFWCPICLTTFTQSWPVYSIPA